MSTRTSRRSSSLESHSSVLSFLDKVPSDPPSPTKSASPSKSRQQGQSPINSPSKRVRSSSYGEVLEKARNSPEASASSKYRRPGYTLGTPQSGKGQPPKPRLTKHASFERSDDQHPLDLGGVHEERRKQKANPTSDPFVGPPSTRARLQKTRADTPPPYATIRPRRPISRPYAEPYVEFTGRPRSPRKPAFVDDMPDAPQSKLFKHANNRLRAAQEQAKFVDEAERGDAAIKSLLKFTSRDEDEFFNLVELATFNALDKQEVARFERKERKRRIIEAGKFYIFGMTMGELYWELMEIVGKLLLFAFSCWLFYAGWTVLTLSDSKAQLATARRHQAA